MPKEAKSDPLFCCGELHKSANYHKRTVHQKYTKIYFKHHPDANFLLKRNPKTCLFHCPQCDKSWAMATPVRNHIFQRCEGYVKYRSPIPSIEDKPTEGVLPTQVKNEDDATMKERVADAAEEMNITDRKESESDALSMDPVQPSSEPAIRGNPTTTPVPPSSPSSASDGSPGPDRPRATMTAHPFPLLRPALWSPVKPTNGIDMNASTRPGVASLAPSLSGGFSSCSSMFSVHTWPDDRPPGVPVPAPRFKAEDDVHILDSASGLASGSASGFGSSSSFGSRPMAMGHVTDLDRPSSAARLFLDGLRRPLGHAARHLHALGIVSEADLDLICTMPDAWDELGELLTRSGVTVIEWLMVKEAFKARARQLSSVV